MSTDAGTYLFKDFEQGKNYNLNLDRRETDMKGININDVIVLLKHLMGTEKITDPYLLIAADIDSNNKIEQADFDLLYALVAGSRSYVDLPKHWRFVRKPYLFSDPLNPFVNHFDEETYLSGIRTSYSNLNYTAIRVGELDGFTGGFSNVKIEDRGTLVSGTGDIPFTLENVFPNPVTEAKVYFKFHLNRPTTLYLSFYGQSGNQLKQYSRSFDKGSQIWELKTPEESYTGMLLYHITDGAAKFSGKLFLSK